MTLSVISAIKINLKEIFKIQTFFNALQIAIFYDIKNYQTALG